MSDLKDFKISAKGVLTKYLGSGGDIVIPDGVKEIAANVFLENKKINSVVIPNSVVRIETEAFYCSGIKSITMPNSVKHFGSHVFSGCDELTNVVFSGGEKGPGFVFAECSRLVDEKGRLIINNILYHYPRSWRHGEDMIVPDGVVEIASKAFGYATVNAIYLPDSIKVISKDAFPGMHIKSIVANECVFAIAWNALDSKQRLELCCQAVCDDAVVNDTLLEFCIKSNKILDSIIEYDRDQLLAVVLESKKTIPLDKLERLIANSPNSPKVRTVLLDYKNKNYPQEKAEEIKQAKIELELGIRDRTDAEWKEIVTLKPHEKKGWIITSYRGDDTMIILPNVIDNKPIVAIGEWAFSPHQQQPAVIKNARKNIVLIELPDSVSYIGKGAFAGCELLNNFKLPLNLKHMDEKVFTNCSSLTNVLNNNNSIYSVLGNCIIHREKQELIYGFNNSNIHANDNITSIGYAAFWGCTELENIVIPDRVLSIGDYAFLGCKNLKKVAIAEGTKKIGKAAFRECDALECIYIPNGMLSIGEFAFFRCKNLTKVSIPSSVNEIGSAAFDRRKNLTIHAPAGSYAEQYAKENNIPFVAE